MELSIVGEDSTKWLTDERWIVFSFYGSFAYHLEHSYFTPGTPKSSEFQIMVTPVTVNNICGIAPFYRIKDTAENRESLRAAVSEFNDKHLLAPAELDRRIKEMRRKMKEKVLPTLR